MDKIPTPTQQEESCVLDINFEKAWTQLWTTSLAAIVPKKIKEMKYISGGPKKVGSTIQIVYMDGAKWDIMVVEISDHRHTLIYQVIKTEPTVKISSIVNIVKFRKVSTTNQTFMKWTTTFSNDADANAVQDNKYKKLDFFKEIAEYIAKNKL